MSFWKRFRKETPKALAPMPTWEQIVEQMYGKQLSGYADRVVDVIYSKDKTKRYVITKNESGLLSYQLETICPFDEEEWKYICVHEDTLPAMWVELEAGAGRSLFSSEKELRTELGSEPEFITHFK